MPETTRAAAQAAGLTSEILLETKSVLFSPDKPFIFTSGRASPVYVDCRRLISFPRARERLMDMAVELIDREIGRDAIDVVAGGETAGIPFAAFIAERLALPMIYIRKQPKGFGRNAQIEGEMAEGARVLLVEDLASEGTSKLNFIRAIRQAGGTIAHTFVVFHYGIFPQSVASLAAEGVQLHALATFWDVLPVAQELGAFTPQQYQAVRAYLENPDGWSAPPAGGAAPGD